MNDNGTYSVLSFVYAYLTTAVLSSSQVFAQASQLHNCQQLQIHTLAAGQERYYWNPVNSMPYSFVNFVTF